MSLVLTLSVLMVVSTSLPNRKLAPIVKRITAPHVLTHMDHNKIPPLHLTIQENRTLIQEFESFVVDVVSLINGHLIRDLFPISE